MMRMAEVEAVRRGCRAATLVTVNFQAPDFYARHGWEEFGRIASAPGVERIFMRKTLAMHEGDTVMQSISVNTEDMEWMPGSPFYGQGAIFEGEEVVHLKVLSDRRGEGGGIAWLVRFTPPAGKVIRIVAVALSDEHIFSLEGGRGTKSGAQLRSQGNYGLNPNGQAAQRVHRHRDGRPGHLYGEPDEIRSMEVLDLQG